MRAHAPPDIEGPDEITCQVGALDNNEHQRVRGSGGSAVSHLSLRGRAEKAVASRIAENPCM